MKIQTRISPWAALTAAVAVGVGGAGFEVALAGAALAAQAIADGAEVAVGVAGGMAAGQTAGVVPQRAEAEEGEAAENEAEAEDGLAAEDREAGDEHIQMLFFHALFLCKPNINDWQKQHSCLPSCVRMYMSTDTRAIQHYYHSLSGELGSL